MMISTDRFIVVFRVLTVCALLLLGTPPDSWARDLGACGLNGEQCDRETAQREMSETHQPNVNSAPSASHVPECISCRTCRDNASEVSDQCANLDDLDMAACGGAIAAASGNMGESQLGLMQTAFMTSSTCLAEVNQKISQCKPIIGQCGGNCTSAQNWLDSALATGGITPLRQQVLLTERNEMTRNQGTCEQGQATLAQLESMKATLAANNSTLLQAIVALGPAALDFLMSQLGSNSGDVCDILKRDLGPDHPSTKACGQTMEPQEIADDDEGRKEQKDDKYPAPKNTNTLNSGLSLGDQEFNGGHERSRESSKVREQSVQASSSGGAPFMGDGSSSASGKSTRYEGAAGQRGFNTNIMGDPQGHAGGRRGAASQGQRSQSQWLQGQQANARAKAEAHKRAAEAAAQRKRELRGPHAQGLFESVSETYRRYQHEMMQ